MSGVLSGGSGPGASQGKIPRWKGRRIGRYRLVDLLGKGSYGRVFVADDVDLHRKVALKIVSAETTAASLRGENATPPATGTLTSQTGTSTPTSEQFESIAAKVVEKTLSEARAAARLEHPNVVHVYEVGRLPAPPGSPPGTLLGGFIAMELLEGGTLHDWVKANGPMEVGRACSLVADAAEALQFAHDQGVVHRDLKPANLMLSRHGRCKVVDFGLAMEHDPDGLNKTPIAGTLMFVAPEVTLGKPPGPKSDQYSLGVTLWALLAARPPYVGNKQELLDGHRNGTPPSLRAIRPDVPEELELAILRAMEKDPDRRFQTIRQFGQTLRTFSGEATAGDATGSFLPDLFADLNDPKAPDAPAKAAPPPPVFKESQVIATPRAAARSPIVRPPVLAGSGLPGPKRAPSSQRPVIWPWMAAAAAAILILLSLAVWALNSGSNDQPEVAQAPTQTAYPQPDQPPVRTPRQTPAQPGVAQTGQQPVQQSNGVGVPQRPPAQPPNEPQTPQQQNGTQVPQQQSGNAPPTAPQQQGDSVPPTMPPVQPPANQGASPQRPPEGPPGNGGPPAGGNATDGAGAGGAAPAGPTIAAGDGPIAPYDFVTLLAVANGADPQRPDKKVVVEGKVEAVRMMPDGMVRVEFAGGSARRTLVVDIKASDQELMSSLQQKLKSKAKHLGLEGRTITVRGQVIAQGTATAIIISSADQLELVAPGEEKLPPAPAGHRGPNRRGTGAR